MSGSVNYDPSYGLALCIDSNCTLTVGVNGPPGTTWLGTWPNDPPASNPQIPVGAGFYMNVANVNSINVNLLHGTLTFAPVGGGNPSPVVVSSGPNVPGGTGGLIDGFQLMNPDLLT